MTYKGFDDYVREHGGKVEQEIFLNTNLTSTVFVFELVGDKFYIYTEDGFPLEVVDKEDELVDYFEEEFGTEIRICTYCGAIMQAGYTDDDGDFYNCEDCFELDMNERYGEGNWRDSEDEEANYLGGYYEWREDEDSEWKPEPSYYTEWY